MRFFKKIFHISITLVVSMLVNNMRSSATIQNQLDVGIAITIEKPENQINNNVSYFDLNVEPGKTQSLVAYLTNTTQEVLNIEALITDAYTTINGTIDYTPHNARYDTMYPFKLSSMLTLEENQLSLQPAESRRVSLTLTVPSDLPKGTVLGGIYLKPQAGNKENSTDNFQIENTYALVKGVQLTYGNRSDVPQEIDIKEAKLENVNQKQTLTLDIRNDSSILYKDEVSIQATIQKDNAAEVFDFVNSQKYSIAPNSVFYFPIDLTDKKITPGSYTVDVNIQIADKVFAKKLQFIVNKEKLNKTKTRAERVKETIPIWIGVAFLGLIGMVFGLLIYILLLKRKNQNSSM